MPPKTARDTRTIKAETVGTSRTRRIEYGSDDPAQAALAGSSKWSGSSMAFLPARRANTQDAALTSVNVFARPFIRLKQNWHRRGDGHCRTSTCQKHVQRGNAARLGRDGGFKLYRVFAANAVVEVPNLSTLGGEAEFARHTIKESGDCLHLRSTPTLPTDNSRASKSKHYSDGE